MGLGGIPNPNPRASWRCFPQVSFPRPTNLLDSVRNLRVLNSPAIFRQQKFDVSTSAWADPRLHVTSGLAKGLAPEADPHAKAPRGSRQRSHWQTCPQGLLDSSCATGRTHRWCWACFGCWWSVGDLRAHPGVVVLEVEDHGDAGQVHTGGQQSMMRRSLRRRRRCRDGCRRPTGSGRSRPLRSYRRRFCTPVPARSAATEIPYTPRLARPSSQASDSSVVTLAS